MPTNFANSETRLNLMRSFAGESQAKNRYDLASKIAENQGMYFIKNIFKFTAHQEEQHSKIFWDFLKQLNGEEITIDASFPIANFDKLEDLLADAQKHENQEHMVVYPAFAKIAMEEGFPAIAKAWEDISKIEGEHSMRFGTFAELLKEDKMFRSDDETEWICLNCGHIHKGKNVPNICPVCAESHGYSVPYKYYKFLANCYSKN